MPTAPRQFSRRQLLASAIVVTATAGSASARTITGAVPWAPDAGEPPMPVQPGPWGYFTAEEAAAVEAIADRLIPADDGTPGGRKAGCAVFIDGQMQGSFGTAERLYMRPPFMNGTPQQGFQSPLTPREQYRVGLAALDAYCRAGFAGKPFAALTIVQQDKILGGLEAGEIHLSGADGRALFELVLQNTMEGFFADPVYGGNKDMAGWKLIGFPGARYDYREYVGRQNEALNLPPVGLQGRPAWRNG